MEFRNVSYRADDEEIVHNIDFKAAPGQTIGIIGSTGAGKSTIMNLLCRFYDTTAGAVRIGGRDVKDYRMEGLRRHIGIVMQKAVLFHGSIRENLQWGNENAAQSSKQMIVRRFMIAYYRTFGSLLR